MNPLRLGIFTGLQQLRDRREERNARKEDRAARDEDRRLAREDRERRQEQESLTLEMAMRRGGYVPEGEAGPDGMLDPTAPDGPRSVSGKTLDDIVGAATGTPMTGMSGVAPRYDGGPKGYKYDRMNPQAERQRRQDAEQRESRTLDMELKRVQLDHARNPRPSAPVPGTPEYFAMKEQEAGIAAKYRQNEPKAPSQPTDYERRAAFLVPKAEAAAKVLAEFYDNGAPLKSALGRVPIVGNYALSPAEQRLQQAAKAVSAAILRLESGGSITEQEIEENSKQFLPLPGDSPEARAQKKAALQSAVESMRLATGRAGDMVAGGAPKGPATDPAAIIKKYGLEP